MVNGFTKFKERFQGFENQYVIIGGTACDLIMENEELPFRATKDVDIVLIVESITAEFGRQFWEYVKEAGYEHLNKSTGNAQFYRFTSPKSKEYPYMIEIFSRNPDFIILEDDAVLTPLPIDDEISSLSARGRSFLIYSERESPVTSAASFNTANSISVAFCIILEQIPLKK